MSKITWSHSRMNCLLNNPAEYYLNYIEKIQPKVEKTALSIGSAIHWGLEHNTSDLQEFYNEKGSFKQYNNYDDEQLLAECIVKAFLKRKEECFKDILGDTTLVDESNELSLVAHADSKMYADGHDFLGIIDKLLLTDKGFILLDYKTSSRDVDWDNYKSQLFKYKFLLNTNFPDIPLYGIGIINLKKTGIRRKKNENDDSYRLRIREEYLNDDTLINWHMYKDEEFSGDNYKNFVKDLTHEMDICRTIVENNLYFVNYSNITGMYGNSQFYDIFYHTKDNFMLYKIKDTIFDEDENTVMSERDCDAIDMMVLENKNVLNKYSIFKDETNKVLSRASVNKDTLFKELKKNWICSDSLLEKYFTTFMKNV